MGSDVLRRNVSLNETNRIRRVAAYASDQLNFFRIHLLLFIVVPLLASLIFYWLNDARTGSQPFVSFIDSLFLCTSAATVAGLYSVVLSNLNVGQQVILALLTAVGSYSFVSTITVVIRRHYFNKAMRTKLQRKADEETGKRITPGVNESPLHGEPKERKPAAVSGHDGYRLESTVSSQVPQSDQGQDNGSSNTLPQQAGPEIFSDQIVPGSDSQPALRRRALAHERNAPVRLGYNMRRTDTMATHKDRGYGGFPPVMVMLRKIVSRWLDRPQRIPLTRTISRKLEVPLTQTLQSVHTQRARPSAAQDPFAKVVPYFTFDTVVGKNSAFQNLSAEEREELGGVELRALNMLAWIVPAYWVCTHLLGFVILAPYMARAQFRDALRTEDGQAAPVNSTWFTLFQVISSYANNGILIDASLVPLQKAYLLLWTMMYLILAGNTAFPIFLRFVIWIASALAPKTSQSYATLRFILDHPRRCFLYLFPSTQTWYLVFVILGLNGVDWVLFLLLDIGNSPISSIPPGIRVMAGLVQAIAVRCGGFQIVSLSSLAPAVQVLYVVMMYIGALPLALGVRSTNVYEDRSMALFEEGIDDDSDPSTQNLPGIKKTQAWGTYITWHTKRQLSFDIWWLALAVFLICVLERGKLLDQERLSYFTVFSIIFEVVSAYGTVGLSLGIPNQNNSFSGALGTVSKLVLCAVMLRGRHRGLPDAIDRSVLLPGELERQVEMEMQFRQQQEAMKLALQNVLETAETYENDTPPGMA